MENRQWLLDEKVLLVESRGDLQRQSGNVAMVWNLVDEVLTLEI